jgi:hypothetical protein
MSHSPALHSEGSKEFDTATPNPEKQLEARDPDTDVEVGGIHKTETVDQTPEEAAEAEELRQLSTREGIAKWKWILTLLGLYLGALLYGMLS